MILCICLSPAVDVTYSVPHLEVGATIRVRGIVRRPGGKAVNVARILHTLREDVRVLAPVGGDTGAEFAAGIAGLGIGADVVPTGPATRRTVTVADESSGAATVLAEPAAIDCWAELVQLASTTMRRAAAVVVSGVAPVGAPDDAFSTLVAIARRAGCPVLVDTSAAALTDALSAGPTMVKPNREELAQATGDADPARAACRIARDHDTIVVDHLDAAR